MNNKTLETFLEKHLDKFYIGDGYFQARCPFHKDDTPSFGIKKSYYKCFSCGKSGRLSKLLDFLSDEEDEMSELKLEILLDYESEDNDTMKSISDYNIELPFSYYSFNYERIHPLLVERIGKKVALKYSIGLAEKEYPGYFIIPINIDTFNYSSYIARHILRNTAFGIKRWLFPSNFLKILFPFQQDVEEVILTEGFFSMLAIEARDFNASCIFGNHLSSLQLEMLLKMNPRRVVICLDSNEEAFFSSTLDIAKVLHNLFEVKIMQLDNGDPEDVDDDSFNASYKNALSYDFVLGEIMRRKFVKVIKGNLEQ